MTILSHCTVQCQVYKVLSNTTKSKKALTGFDMINLVNTVSVCNLVLYWNGRKNVVSVKFQLKGEKQE